MSAHEATDVVDALLDDGLCDTLYALYAHDGGEYQGPHPFKLLCASHGLSEAYVGCTKAVVAVDARRVLKFPLFGCANAELVDGTTEIYGRESYNCDHCAVETDVFGKACAAGLQAFFNRLSVLCRRKNLPVYICDKASHVKDVAETSRSMLDGDVLSFFDKTNAEYGIASMLISSYGLQKTIDLCKFLGNSGIYDICSNNWGYVDGNLKLIDYSGFVG